MSKKFDLGRALARVRKADPARVREGIKRAGLDHTEEVVLRARLGCQESSDAPLESRGQNNDLTRRRLAEIERDTLRSMRKRPKPRKGQLAPVPDDLA